MQGEDFKKTETKILKFWKDNKIFQKSFAQRKKAKPFVFYEGPPTTNGLPHIGHFLTRVYKDLYGRYKTMRGFFVLRRAGWDTHGLPVEIEVEKQLGLKSKKEIEEYGVAKFNRRARESVWKYKTEWEKMTERMGFWIDMDNPYITYEPSYIESVWWVIKKIADKKLLYQGHKVVPFCTRCGTPLSSHEVAQGYQDVTETSVYVKFEIKNPETHNLKPKTYLLAWTTTSWTLPGNVALAVGEKIKYVEAEKNGERYILAKDLVAKLGNEGVRILKEISGKELVGLQYKPLFDIAALKSKTSYRVYPADFVTTTDGTGIVHTAVMYGEEDYELGKKTDLPTHHTVDEQGKFTSDVPEFSGQYVKSAEKGIIDYLKRRNLLLKTEDHLHTYPFCWRCATPLLYYAKNSWFIKMSAVNKQLLKNNQTINWIPGHLKNGRFGEFIKEGKDWNLSRERYWGTPLPIWTCVNCQTHIIVGSFEELEKNRYKEKNTYYLLRHGMSTKNLVVKGGIIASQLESDTYDLTPKGVEQITKIARDLKKSGGVDLIITSPFLRTKHSAQIVSDYLGIKYKTDKRLKELDHGTACEGQAHPLCIPPEIKVDFDTRRGEGERWRDVKIRAASLVKELEQNQAGKKILLVTHGDPIWILQGLASGLSEKQLIIEHDKNYPLEGKLIKVFFKNYPRNDEGGIDPHRPYVDEITIKCKKCKGPMKRIPELADAWFDSGSMPLAQWHYPFENKKLVNSGVQFPADYISEAIDQTRGWFYTLLAIATALGRKTPYKNLIVVGHTLDVKGLKMSKSKGNMMMANDTMEQLGADSIRWYFYTVTSPGNSIPVSIKDIQTKLFGFISTLQNTVRFYELYLGETMATDSPEPRNKLDIWLVSHLESLIIRVTKYLDEYDPTTAARGIEEFVINDLSNWWVRRSRKRFQRPASLEELAYAASILRYILRRLAKIIAPFTPFLAEDLHLRLHKGMKPQTQSVHLDDWPLTQQRITNDQLLITTQMEEVRKFVTEGLAARKAKQFKVRQPLAGATLKCKEKFDPELEELIKDELNVKEIKCDPDQAKTIVLDEKLTEALIREGYAREIVRQIQDMRKEAKYKLNEKVRAAWESADTDLIATIHQFEKDLTTDTLLEKFDRGHNTSLRFDAEKEFELAPGKKVWLGVRSKKF